MKELKINQEIDATDVILIDQEGKSQGKVSLDQALYLAHLNMLDLVQVGIAQSTPVVKIMDYGKYRYSQEKQESKQKVKSRAPETKEVRLSLKISAHDLDFKAKQAEKFLKAGDKVKVTVKLLGREMMFSGRVKSLLEDFRQKAGAAFDTELERMGNRFSIVLRKNQDETKDLQNSQQKN